MSESSLTRALHDFRHQTGSEATHLVYAPGRVNLIGEHTDYNGGFVLPMAIDRGVWIAARLRGDEVAVISSAQMRGESARFDLREPIAKGLPAWSNYARGPLAGLQEAGIAVPGFEALVDADLPDGGGLSSSAAVEVAFATLGEALAGVKLDPLEKARLCQKAEHVFAGVPSGLMDQLAVIFGRKDHLLLIDCASLERQLIPMASEDVSIVVINTMVKHALGDGGYKSRRADCEEAARTMGVSFLRELKPEHLGELAVRLPERLFRRARHVVTENERTLAAAAAIRAGEWMKVGELMYASHDSLRDDFEVSCVELDLVVETARGIGAGGGVQGCRMTGGGFGGCCVALVNRDATSAVTQTIAARYKERTGIEATIFVTRPADGARILTHP